MLKQPLATDSTTEALVGGLTLDLEGLTLAQVEEEARFRCSVKNVGSLASVVFLFNQTEVARFDVRSDTSTSSTHRFSLENRKTSDGYELLLTLTNVTCGDAGRYTCLASNGGDVVERWTRLSVMSKSGRVYSCFPFLFLSFFRFVNFLLIFFY